MLKPSVIEWLGLQVRPKAVVNPTWTHSRFRESGIAGGELVIVQQCKSGLAIQDPLVIEYRYTGVVQVCSYEGHGAILLVSLHVANQLVIRIIFGIEYQAFLQQL